jgi:serine/threonine protein kinase
MRNTMQVKIGDFGFSGSFDQTCMIGLTQAGSPNYMSPEMVVGGQYGPSSDVWSVGCILYQMLTGRIPFIGNTLMEVYNSIQFYEPDFNFGNYSIQLRCLVRQMLCKEPFLRLKLNTILEFPFISQIQRRFPQQFLIQNSHFQFQSNLQVNQFPPQSQFQQIVSPQQLITPSPQIPTSQIQILNFPIQNRKDGIFEFLCQLSLSELINELTIDCSHNNPFWIFKMISLNSVCFCDTNPDSTKYFQISFKNFQIQINGYLIKCGNYYLRNWKLEGIVSQNHIILDEQQKNNVLSKENSQSSFNLNQSFLTSSIRLTQTGPNSKGNSDIWIEFFDIFGQINSLYLQNLISKSRLSISSSNIFEFNYSTTSHSGLFNFLMSIPWKETLKIFQLYNAICEKDCFPMNLLFWNNDSFISTNIKENRFVFAFLPDSGFKFLPAGYRIRSSNRYFPKNWRIESDDTYPPQIIDTKENETSLCSSFSEKSFPISTQKYFQGFTIIQTGLNSEGTNHFSLSGFEIFGILKKF